jgi:hypothetical protein
MLTGLLSPDALMRVSVMLIVAFVVGAIVEQMHGYDAQIMEKNRELSEADEKLHAPNVRLAEPGKDLQVANKKLQLLSGTGRDPQPARLSGP